MSDRGTNVHNHLPGRRGLLITILLVLVAIEVATVTAVVMSQRVRTEKALALHTRQLLRDVADRTRRDALIFLTQAQNVVQLTESLFASNLLSLDRPEELEQYFLDQLALVSQMDGLYFAGPNGEFLFTKRSSSGAASHYETKIIDRPAYINTQAEISNSSILIAMTARIIRMANDMTKPRKLSTGCIKLRLLIELLRIKKPIFIIFV